MKNTSVRPFFKKIKFASGTTAKVIGIINHPVIQCKSAVCGQ